MSDELRSEAMDLSEKYRRQGHSCCESTIRALGELYGFPVSERLLRSTSAFSGGAAEDGRCGVLEAGLAMAANLLDDGDRADALEWSVRLHRRFEDELGSWQCRDLFYPLMRQHEASHLPESEFRCVFQPGIAAVVGALGEMGGRDEERERTRT